MGCDVLHIWVTFKQHEWLVCCSVCSVNMASKEAAIRQKAFLCWHGHHWKFTSIGRMTDLQSIASQVLSEIGLEEDCGGRGQVHTQRRRAGQLHTAPQVSQPAGTCSFYRLVSFRNLE